MELGHRGEGIRHRMGPVVGGRYEVDLSPTMRPLQCPKELGWESRDSSGEGGGEGEG